MKIREVISALEHFAPLPLQESYDNSGLQVGLTEAETSGALLCLDVTEDVVSEAVRLGCNLIVAHHPLLFKPLRRVGEATQAERVVRLAIRHDITIYAAHTNLDNAEDGVNYKMAEKLGLIDVEPLSREQGGLIGYLPEGEDALMFLQRVKSVFRIECLQHNELLPRLIERVALCGGAGSFLLPEAIAKGADAFLTGEIGYHLFFGHEGELQLAALGHYQSEQYTTEIFQSIIEEAAPALPIFTTTIATNPINYLI